MVQTSSAPALGLAPTRSDAAFDWLGIGDDPATFSPVYHVRLTPGPEASFGRSVLDENHLVQHHAARGKVPLMPLYASPLTGADASVRVLTSAVALRIGIHVGAEPRVDGSLSERLLPVRLRGAAARRRTLDRLRFHEWAALDGPGVEPQALGVPRQTPQVWLLHDWLARETGQRLNGALAPTHSFLRPFSDPWGDYVCLPMRWFEGRTPWRIEAGDKARYWFEVRWPVAPERDGAELEGAFELDVQPFVDCVLTLIDSSELEPTEGGLMRVRGQKVPQGRVLRILCAIGSETGEIRWDAGWMWSRRGRLLTTVETLERDVPSLAVQLPPGQPWKLIAYHRPRCDRHLSDGTLVPEGAKRTVSTAAPAETRAVEGRVESVATGSWLASPPDSRSAFFQALRAAQSLTRRVDFVAAVLEANLFDMAAWIDSRGIDVTMKAGRLEQIPVRYVSVSVPLRDRHGLSREDLVAASHELSLRLQDASAIHLPVRVEVSGDCE